MLSVAIAVGSVALFYLAYRFYGGYLARRVFVLRDEEMAPSVEMKDGIDYVPTNKWILFGHHFASIAGLGPILGPAVAVIWGWLPGLVWVLAGTILIGAVHDFGALVASARHKGRSIGEVVGQVVGGRARVLFIALAAFLIALAMGVFAFTIADLFAKLYPEAVIASFGLMGLAVVLGLLIYKQNLPLAPVTVFGIVVMAALLWAGIRWRDNVNIYKRYLDDDARTAVLQVEQTENTLRGDTVAKKLAAAANPHAPAVSSALASARTAWTWVLLLYAGIASVIPVWLLLQPRDYINSYLLYAGLILLFAGIFVVRPGMAAPAYMSHPAGAPPLFPFLFVTIACGAVSGFHSLVASGTTAKQLGRVKEAHFIGYGSMLVESVLAVVVILACAAGVGAGKFGDYYTNWTAVEKGGMTSRSAAAFVDGGANLLSGLGIPAGWGKAIIALVIVSFALTTLDTGTRLLRYNLEELGKAFRLPFVGNRFVATAIGVALLAFFAFVKVNTPVGPQPAGIAIWNLFGASNQVLAALGLLAVAAYLRLKGRPIWMFLLPAVFLLAVTGAALYYRFDTDIKAGNWQLLATESITVLLVLWLIVEGVLFFARTPAGGADQSPRGA